MHPSRIEREPVARRRFTYRTRTYSSHARRSVLLGGLVVLVIASILLCLPAFHSATNLHHGGGSVDAFDLGVNVPETSRGSLLQVLGAFFLVGLWSARLSTAAIAADDRPAGLHGVIGRVRTSAPSRHRVLRRALAQSGDSDDGSDSQRASWLPNRAMTPRRSAKPRGAGGSFVVPAKGARGVALA